MSIPSRPKVGLFVTCLVDLFRPTVGFAAVKLLEAAGCDVEVPAAQTCCGQPAYNSGDRADAARHRRAGDRRLRALRLRRGAVGLVRRNDQAALCRPLSRRRPAGRRAPSAFGEKVFELISFLVDVRGMTSVDAAFAGTVTYHDSCSGLRELGVRDQPRRLLKTVDGLEAHRAAGSRCLLRLRRHVLRQVSRHLERHRREEDGGDRRRRRRHAARRRSRLPDEHGRQASAPEIGGRRPATSPRCSPA